jgi:large conductance mechanosensitive channel
VLEELKNFLFRGNIVELAVAFVMGVAFAAVINSLVDNLVMPIVAMIIGKPDFSSLTFTINDAVFRYGAFITDVIQFLAIGGAVFFFVVKPVQAMLERSRRTPIEEGMPDEERRHQELLAALRERGERSGLSGRRVWAPTGRRHLPCRDRRVPRQQRCPCRTRTGTGLEVCECRTDWGSHTTPLSAESLAAPNRDGLTRSASPPRSALPRAPARPRDRPCPSTRRTPRCRS